MYRISYGAPRPFDVDLDALDDVALVGLQMHANEWFARRARVLLQERGAGARALESLRALLLRHPEERVRLRALWTLYAVGGLDAASMRAAQRDPSPALRAWCLQLGLERPGALAGFEHLPAAADPDPLVRLYAAAGLQRLPLEERWELASRLAAHGEDAGEPNLPHVLWYGAAELVEADPERALLLARACAIPLFAEHTARRAAELKDGLEPCVRAIGDETEPTRRAALFTGLERALAGMRDAAAPPSWPRVRAELEQDPALAPRLAAIALAFGEVNDAGALARTLADPDAPRAEREQALAALLRVADPGLAPLCHELLQDAGLAGPALRALAALGDAATPARVLAAWGGLDAGLRRDAASALAGRAAWADELLSALERGELARSELSASAVRSIQSHGDPELDRRAAALFGTLRSTPAEKATRIAELKAEFPAEVLAAADLPRGRALFAETCAKCHRLFGSGGDIGPDLTGSNRADLGYLLHNLVDPSAEVGRDYLATVAWLSDGRVVSGLLRSQTPSAVTLCTESETLVLSRGEIEELVASELSTMPEGLLDGLDKHARRDLFAYLGSPSQVPRRLQPGEERELFDGATLAGWIGDPALWSVEGGEIVGRSAGLAENAFLRSEALLADFRLTLAVRLAGDAGNGGIQFRSRELAGGDVAGYQADIGPGYWATLYEEHGRGPLAQAAVPPPLRPGDWNTYSITAVGTRIRLELNGTRTVDLDDSQAAHAAREGILALQLHAGGPTEIRFRDLRLELDPKLED
jgi:putative heme-binding domain-containing protein